MTEDRTARKPDTRTAMRRLIGQVRAAMPFDQPEARSCRDDCQGWRPNSLEGKGPIASL